MRRPAYSVITNISYYTTVSSRIHRRRVGWAAGPVVVSSPPLPAPSLWTVAPDDSSRIHRRFIGTVSLGGGQAAALPNVVPSSIPRLRQDPRPRCLRAIRLYEWFLLLIHARLLS